MLWRKRIRAAWGSEIWLIMESTGSRHLEMRRFARKVVANSVLPMGEPRSLVQLIVANRLVCIVDLSWKSKDKSKR